MGTFYTREYWVQGQDFKFPTFEIPPIIQNKQVHDQFTIDSITFSPKFYNVTLNNNCLKFLRKVFINPSISKYILRDVSKDTLLVSKNPYINENVEDVFDEWHLCSLYLRPGFYNSLEEIVDEINYQFEKLLQVTFNINTNRSIDIVTGTIKSPPPNTVDFYDTKIDKDVILSRNPAGATVKFQVNGLNGKKPYYYNNINQYYEWEEGKKLDLDYNMFNNQELFNAVITYVQFMDKEVTIKQ